MPLDPSSQVGRARYMRWASHIAGSALGIFSTILGNALIFLIVARALSPSEFGKYGQAYAVCSMFGLVVDFGYPQRLLRDLPHYVAEHGNVPARILHLKLVLTALVTPVTLGLSIFLAGGAWVLGAILWVGIALISYGNFFGSVMRADGRHVRDSINLLIANLLGAATTGIIALAPSPSPKELALGTLVIGLTYLPLARLSALATARIVPEPVSLAKLREEFFGGITYASDIFVARAYGFADVILLSAMVAPASVGIYQLGQKLMQIALPFAQAFNNVLLPIFARQFHRGAQSKAASLAPIIIMGTAGLIGFLMFSLIGPLVIGLAFSPAYHPLKTLMPLFGGVILIRFITASLAILMTSSGMQSTRLRINALALITFVPSALALSSLFGLSGMLAALIASAALSASLYALFIFRSSR
ncbi:MAG: hypothetical protein CMH85_15560 [Novosphingobium sp.]|nr:hypothetical protein [Novosphingobium sp.]|tara:strand:- start:315 stop:1568 length:1254 start_codon:yes stop_codon:yes gene_type:complete